MDVTVAISTFGADHWFDLACERARPSADALDVSYVHAHSTSLHEARNLALSHVHTEWVCFLDADDELEAGYFTAMKSAWADLRAPAVRYVRGRHRYPPVMPKVAGHEHDCEGACLPDGNWLVVGTLVRADLVRQVGGWRDWPMFEDWDLWLRCWQAGATVEAVPAAVYRAYVRSDSRNRAPSREACLAAHQAIAEANGVPVPA